MKITIDGVLYDTRTSEAVCQRFSETVDDASIRQTQETVYRTEDGRYFSYTWEFRDTEENDIEEDCIEESVRTMTREELILWLRIDGLAKRFQRPPTTFFPINKSVGIPSATAENATA